MDINRGNYKTITLADRILDITDIRKMEIIFRANSSCKAGWSSFSLDEAINMGVSETLALSREMLFDKAAEQMIKLART